MKKVLLPAVVIVILVGLVYALKNQKPQIPTTVSENTQIEETSQTDIPTECSGKPLVELTEGPYYKSGSPDRQKIAEANTPGTHLILKGYVVDTDCQPISHAWLDFWQADGDGAYDNVGYNLRGHQYTDANGFFRVETVVPGEYPGRTEHIHFKVRATDSSPVITSQFFFPESSGNTTDRIFDESLTVEFGTDPDGSTFASYTIIVPED